MPRKTKEVKLPEVVAPCFLQELLDDATAMVHQLHSVKNFDQLKKVELKIHDLHGDIVRVLIDGLSKEIVVKSCHGTFL